VGFPNGTGVTRAALAASIGVVLLLQVVVVNFWPAFPSPNERARAYQAMAVARRGSLAIDDEVRRFGGMEDLATAAGRLYPNKAPGATVLVVPAALVARAVAGGAEERELALTLVLGRLLAAGLPFLLTLLLLARRAQDHGAGGATLAVIAFALATPALTASLLLFSHALAAFLLLAAFVLLYRPEPTAPACAAAAGLTLGWAVTTEYPVVVPAAVLVALALPRLRLAGAAALAAGGALPALALAAYNQACFGSPLALSSGRETYAGYASLAEHGLFGVGAPAADALAGLMVSPARGLMVWAPLAVLAAGGLRGGRSGGTMRTAALVGAPLALLVLLSGYPNWHGGWFPGPRYLLAVLPLLFVLVGRAEGWALRTPVRRTLAAAAALWGLAHTWLAIAAFPFPPEDFALPSLTFSMPLLGAGALVPSWLPRPALVAVLALAAVAAVTLVLRAACRGPREALAACALAAAVLVLAASLPAPPTFRARLEQAVVHDLYAPAARSGALEALLATCEAPDQRERVVFWIAERDRHRRGKARDASAVLTPPHHVVRR